MIHDNLFMPVPLLYLLLCNYHISKHELLYHKQVHVIKMNNLCHEITLLIKCIWAILIMFRQISLYYVYLFISQIELSVGMLVVCAQGKNKDFFSCWDLLSGVFRNKNYAFTLSDSSLCFHSSVENMFVLHNCSYKTGDKCSTILELI